MAQDNSIGETWKGSSISEISNNKGVWSFNVTPVNISNSHSVLYTLPVTFKEPPAPHRNSDPKHWDSNHVRMPYSDKNLFPVTEDGIDVIKFRWNIIKESLSRPINNSRELEDVIQSYNSPLPHFSALHGYFDELEDEENAHFFKNLLPKIISLCLALPEIVPGSIPLLKQKESRSLSLSQQQIASLLANAFLCTFPWRKNIAHTYPGVNFIGLFIADQRPKRINCVREKMKCIFNYFHMVTKSMPLGVVTFERKSMPKSKVPRWDYLDSHFNDTKVHIGSDGTIENNGLGFLQVDFANKSVGGGVLRYGCVQEEIRFIICPELIISRLFVEQLLDLEAVIVTGVQRYSKYSGYSDSFSWEGPFHDNTPYDEYGRRRTTICIIDATRYSKFSQQFYPSAMLREINKAYVGFHSRDKVNLAPVATGNWGCGAFKGTPYLKAILQLMACVASGRHMVYYTFENVEFRDDFYNMYLFLTNNNIKIAELWKLLCGFLTSQHIKTDLYPFIKKAYYSSKKQPSIRQFFKTNDLHLSSKKDIDNEAGPSNVITSPIFYQNKEEVKDSNWNSIKDLTFENIEETPSEKLYVKEKKVSVSKLSNEKIVEKLPTTDIGLLIDEMDVGPKAKKTDKSDLIVHADKHPKRTKKCNSSLEDSDKIDLDIESLFKQSE